MRKKMRKVKDVSDPFAKGSLTSFRADFAIGRLITEEKMALAHQDYARAVEIANKRIRLEALRPPKVRTRRGRVVAM